MTNVQSDNTDFCLHLGKLYSLLNGASYTASWSETEKQTQALSVVTNLSATMVDGVQTIRALKHIPLSSKIKKDKKSEEGDSI